MSSKLLVADDSVTIQRVIELTFADEDVDVIAVGDGHEAVHRIETERPDIVLADVSMPERDGYEVASFVKGSPHLSHIPVLLLTGAFEPVDEGRAREVACDGVLAKPFEPQAVIDRVKELLSTRRPRRDEREVHPLGPAEGEPEAEPMLHSVRTIPPAYEEMTAGPETPLSSGHDSLDGYFDRLDAEFGNRRRAGGFDEVEDVGGPAAREQDSPGSIERFAARGFRQDLPKPEPVTPPARAEQTAKVLAPDFQARSQPAPAPTPASAAPQEPFTVEAFAQDIIPSDERLTQVALDASLPQAFAPAPPQSMQTDEARQSTAGAAPRPVQPPPLADTFAALLAAEQGLAPEPTSAYGEDFVDEVARRVLERISQRLTREMVTEVVLNVADRLVRQELENLNSGR